MPQASERVGVVHICLEYKYLLQVIYIPLYGDR